MKIEKNLKKQIVIEIIALIFLIVVIVYAMFAIGKNNYNKIHSKDGLITILDDTNIDKLSILSDGEGIMQNGVSYTITNNSKKDINYNLIITPSIKDTKVLEKIRIGIDDLYIKNLTDLDKKEDSYIISSYDLKPNYTKKHLIKTWYSLDTSKDLFKDNIKFSYSYELVKE